MVPTTSLSRLTPHSIQPSFCSKTGCLPWAFDGFLKRFGSLGSEWKWKVPLDISSFRFFFFIRRRRSFIGRRRSSPRSIHGGAARGGLRGPAREPRFPYLRGQEELREAGAAPREESAQGVCPSSTVLHAFLFLGFNHVPTICVFEEKKHKPKKQKTSFG